MDSVTIFLYSMVGIIFLIFTIYAVGYFKNFRKNKSTVIKAVKFRAQNILQDEDNFGSAVVKGVDYVGSAMNRGYVLLMGQDGRMFKQHYWEDQLYPINALQAIGGSERALWSVRSSRRRSGDFVDADKLNVEKQNVDMRNRELVLKAETKIKVNEAATLPDQINDLIEKAFKTSKQEQVKVIR